MSITRKGYETVGRVVGRYNVQTRVALATEFADEFSREDASFNRQKFFESCGLFYCPTPMCKGLFFQKEQLRDHIADIHSIFNNTRRS